jgi:hypothetical protein
MTLFIAVLDNYMVPTPERLRAVPYWLSDEPFSLTKTWLLIVVKYHK